MASLDLQKLSDELSEAAVGDSSAFPGRINKVLTSWLQESVFQLLWTAMIFVVFAFVFYGAFLYFTAYGDENRALMAKKTITYAFVGLAVGAAAIGIAMYVNNILVNSRYTPTPVTAPVTESTRGGATTP